MKKIILAVTLTLATIASASTRADQLVVATNAVIASYDVLL